MFELDKWREIFSTMRKNKTRTALTGFSVAWGIFILIVLLGMGNGIENGVRYAFKDDAVNSMWIYPRKTNLPYDGFKPGRQIQLTNSDHDYLLNSEKDVEHITSRFSISGDNTVVYKNQSFNYNIRCTHPAHKYLENTEITHGRFISDLDLQEFRKVAVIGQLVKEDMFGNTDPIGKYIKIQGIPFQVIGVFYDSGGSFEMRTVYLPIHTAQKVFNGQDRVNQIMFTIDDPSTEKGARIERETREKLATRLNFDPRDDRAVFIRNNFEFFQQYMDLFRNIRIFVWIIGTLSLLAGIIGISNIMLIVVKERTREFGIRKAMGATPRSIVALILQESVLVTGISGYLGLAAGVGTVDLVAGLIQGADYFRNPEIDFVVAISATVLLVFFGTLAGLFPALRAARIQPIVALRDE